MPTTFEITKQTKAPMSKALDYYSHPENLPKYHPDFVKDAKVLSSEGDTITVEEHAEMMGRKLRFVNKMALNRNEHRIDVDTLDGDGKGSKIMISLKEMPAGTELHYRADMEFGALGFLVKGRAKASFEKVADEDARAMDAL